LTTTFRAADLSSDELEESLLTPPSATPLTGDITVRSRVVYTSAGNEIVSGTWESEPGEARWDFTTRGEIIHVLSGRMTVTEDDGEPVEIVPGTTAYFPIGWTGVWNVHEKLRKVFVVYAAPVAEAK
jgi:uncharacterized cupin superfamily protein